MARREKSIFYLRHRLQKCFLSGDTPPVEKEMPDMDHFFTQLEQHKDLEPQIIRKTKIHKVLKNIVRLQSIPRDEEFNFKSRSADMLNHWNNALSATDGDTSVLEPAATTNGESKSEEPTKEPAEAPVEASNPGNEATDEATDTVMTDEKTTEPKSEKPETEESKVEVTEEASEEVKGAEEAVEA